MVLHSMLGLLCLLPIILSANVSARPVSYPGGWTVMQANDADKHSLHLHYSPTKDYSIGYKAEYWRDEDWQFHGLQLNNLIKRWNGQASQANFYLKSGLGVAYSDYQAFDHRLEPAAFTGIALDWEDRRYFTSYENHLYYAGDIDRFYHQSARVGIAPYIGNYGDLHTWLILQVDHAPADRDKITFTPMVRLFKSETLVEAGMSDNGDILFNFILRY